MIEGLQGTMITGGGIMMIDGGLIIMTVAGTGKTEDATRRRTGMMTAGTGMLDGLVEVENPWPWTRKKRIRCWPNRNRGKASFLLMADDAKFLLSLSLSRLEIGVIYMPTLYYFSLDLRNIVRIVIVPVGSLGTATIATTSYVDRI